MVFDEDEDDGDQAEKRKGEEIFVFNDEDSLEEVQDQK